MRKRHGPLGIAVLLLSCAHWAWAEEFVVNHLADVIDTEPGDGRCLTKDQQCTLRAAIQEANALSGPDSITLPAGTYTLSLTGEAENKAAKGDLDVTEDLTLRGEARATTIIDGMGADRIFDIYRTSAEQDTRVELSQLTLIRGTVRIDSSHGGAISNYGTLRLTQVTLEENTVTGIGSHGGALCNRGGTITLEDVVIRNNKARANGGGLCNLDSGTAYLNRVEVASNATDQDGSNHHHGGAMVSNGTLIVRDSVFAQNRSYYGGALFLTAGLVNLDGVTIEGNRSILHGGGLHVGSHDQDGAPAPVDLTVVRSTIKGNELTEGGSAGHGGGLFITGQSLVYMYRTEINTNSARGPCTACSIDGGGIYNDTGDVTLNEVTLEGNRAARFGGGIYNSPDRPLRIVASTLRDNRANQGGGGLASELSFTDTGAPTTTVEYSLIAFNRAPNGGGVAGSALLRNTTLWGNVAYIAGAATGNGGAIYIPAPGPAGPSGITYPYRTELIHVTVGMNTAADTSAQLHNADGIVRLQNSMIARPDATMNCTGRIDTLDYNFDSDASCNLDGPNDSATDPQVEDLTDNGGPTLSAAPAAESPAIASIASEACAALDQRLSLRETASCTAGAIDMAATTPTNRGVITFATDALEIPAESMSVAVRVERRDGNEGPAAVDYILRGRAATDDDTDSPAKRGTLTWDAGDTEPKTVTLTFLDEGNAEQQEDELSIELRNPVGVTLGDIAVLEVNIAAPATGGETPAESPPPPENGDSGGGTLNSELLALFAAVWWRRRPVPRRRTSRS